MKMMTDLLGRAPVPARAPAPMLSVEKFRGPRVMGRLTDKLSAVKSLSKTLSDEIEARADKLIVRAAEVREKTEDAFQPHERILDEAEKGLGEVEDALKQLSNVSTSGSGD